MSLWNYKYSKSLLEYNLINFLSIYFDNVCSVNKNMQCYGSRIKNLMLILFGYIFILYEMYYESKSKKNLNFDLIIFNYQQNPFFSILISNYNKIKYLNRCFSTIICQNFKYYEIIFVDDFSKDGSIEYVKNITNHKIKIVKHKENKGTLAARINSVKTSSGKYLITLDPDDQLVCGLLDELYKHSKDNEYDIIQYQHEVLSKRGEIGKTEAMPVASGIFNRTEILKIKWKTWSLCRICVKRSLMLKGISAIQNNLSYMIGSEDLVLFFSVLLFVNNYKVIDYFGYIYTYNNHPKIIRKKRNENYQIGIDFISKLWAKHNLTVQFK